MTNAKWCRLFGTKLKNLIYISDMTQRELAIKAKLSESTLSKYCNGERMPKIQQLIKLADALGCSIDDLVRF